MQTQVVVVGAGPVGLASAIGLVKAGIEVIIVDAAKAGINDSRAAVIHANTLEALRSVGLADALVQEGIKGTAHQMYEGPHRFLYMPYTCLKGKTNYPFNLMLAQHHTERILINELTSLGVSIKWEHKAISIAASDGGIIVGFENGSTITGRYVVGADGSHSSIRTLIGFSFTDPVTGAPFHSVQSQNDPRFQRSIVADIAVRGSTPPSWARDKVTFHYGGGFFVTIPLPSATYPHSIVPGERDLTFWRIATSASDRIPPKPMTVEFVQSQLDRVRDNFCVEVAAVFNGNRFRVRHAVAEEFYRPLGSGHVLLVGDAAHSHSPAGGQGLNLGFCDAVALTETISTHTKSQKDQVLLDYSTNRRRRAIQVIEFANSAQSIFDRLLNSTFFRRWIVGFILNRVGFLKSWIIWRLSGLGTNAAAAK